MCLNIISIKVFIIIKYVLLYMYHYRVGKPIPVYYNLFNLEELLETLLFIVLQSFRVVGSISLGGWNPRGGLPW